MRLGVRVGLACRKMLDEKMRNIECTHIEVDEIWAFVGKKQSSVRPGEEEVGSIWAFVAIDPDSKLIPSFRVGTRDSTNSQLFLVDLASRMKNRIQLSTDGMNSYLTTVEEAFGSEIDYGQVVKKFDGNGEDVNEHRKYSPKAVTDISKKAILGKPDEATITTSHVEAQNLTMRTHIRRMTRLTSAFSKKFENHCAAIALHFAYYNFCKIHSSIRMTPAMCAGIAKSQWGVEDLVELVN